MKSALARTPPLSRVVLAGVALLPALAYVALEVLGYMRLARLGVMGLGAAAVAAVFFVQPRWALYFLVVYVYSGINFFLPINLAPLVLAVAVAAMLLDWVRGRATPMPDAFFWIASGLFALVALNSMLVAHNVAASLRELFTFAKVVVVVLLVVHLIRTPEELRSLAYAVFFGAVGTIVLGVSAISLGLEGAGDNYIGGMQILRFAGVHEDPNKAAAYMCSAVPMGIFAIRNARHWALRLLFIAGVVTLIGGIYASFSRSTFISLAIVLVGAAAYELRGWRSFAAAAVLVGVVALIAPRFYWERVLGLSSALQDTTQDWSLYTRMLALRTAWEMFLAHPIMGIGLGNFVDSSAYRLFVRIVVHNTYLEILVGTGIAGLCVFVAALGSGVRHAFAGARRHWTRYPSWMRSLSFYTVLSAVSIGVSALFATMPFRYPLWIPVAAGLVIGNLCRADRPVEG